MMDPEDQPNPSQPYPTLPYPTLPYSTLPTQLYPTQAYPAPGSQVVTVPARGLWQQRGAVGGLWAPAALLPAPRSWSIMAENIPLRSSAPQAPRAKVFSGWLLRGQRPVTASLRSHMEPSGTVCPVWSI